MIKEAIDKILDLATGHIIKDDFQRQVWDKSGAFLNEPRWPTLKLLSLTALDDYLNTVHPKPAVIGVQFMGDLFHEDVPDSFRDDIYAVMHGCDRHTYLILTKRMDNLVRYTQTHFLSGYQGRDHIWHGLTVCTEFEEAKS